MQFQVPQFIEVEDKIFGPLTFKQFIYVGGGAGACYLLWRELPIYIAGPLILVIASFAAALAFFQYNGRPFIVALENAFFYFTHTRLYLWNNERSAKVAVKQEKEQKLGQDVYIPHLSESKLHELAWSLDIKERIAAGINPANERERPDVMANIKTAQAARIR